MWIMDANVRTSGESVEVVEELVDLLISGSLAWHFLDVHNMDVAFR